MVDQLIDFEYNDRPKVRGFMIHIVLDLTQ